jgi:hypothetical protein
MTCMRVFSFLSSKGGRAGCRGELHFGAVRRRGPWVGRVLWAGWWLVLESVKCFGDISGHRYVNIVVGVIPVDCQATILAAGPIDGDCVVCLKCSNQVECIIVVEVFYSEIIDSECERGREGDVVPEAGCVCDWLVACFKMIVVVESYRVES